MAIYCWGCNEHGELGFGGIEEEQIFLPRKMSWEPSNSCVIQISSGRSHTLFLTSSGKIYSCGNNYSGQLGHEFSTKRPRMSAVRLIAELENYVITQVSAGARHSMALNEWGQILVWGNNDYGQLGITNSADEVTKPKIVRDLLCKHVVQITCGHNHSLVLTNCGELYAWGSNMYGQLGVGSTDDLINTKTPCLITALRGIPIAYITCGDNHTFVISKSGAVFGWGLNSSGQLGLNNYVNRDFPTQLKTLRSLGVRYISCGEDFSVFLTNDGGVFTCGSGRYGQLGHGGNANEVLPRKVVELMGTTVTEIACGTKHTLALVPSRGRIYAFGLGCAGQLGRRVPNSSSTPVIVLGPWVSPSLESKISEGSNSSYIVKQLFSGGDHSLVICTKFEDKIPAVDCREYDTKTQILHFTEELAEEIARFECNATVDTNLSTSVELIFKSLACINGSFLLPDYRHLCCTTKHHGIDFQSAEMAFQRLSKGENESLKSLIWDDITNGLMSSLTPAPPDVESLRIYLLLPFYHEFVNSKHYEYLQIPFSKAIFCLEEIHQKIVLQWWSEMPSDWFEHLISNYKDVIIYIICFKIPSPTSSKKVIKNNLYVMAALQMLTLFHSVNSNRKDKIHHETFLWSELIEFVDIKQDYADFIYFDGDKDPFNICNYPFLFDAAAKTMLFQTDQAIQKEHAMRTPSNHNLLSYIGIGLQTYPFVIFNVTRENLVNDTLGEIEKYTQSDLKKPLKVKFRNEEAEDGGGVRKEFFMLVLKDLLDPKYGMFKEYEDSRFLWFTDVTFETLDMYYLVGVVCGLAIYNFNIINLRFPLALYKKLLNIKIDFSDLRELSPTLANSMQQILDYNGVDFEETFDLRFEICRNIFEEAYSKPLKPNGENIIVSLENRQEFVDLYVDFIFNTDVAGKFQAFQEGFLKVCSARTIQIFRPEELMAMIVGSEEYDWKTLEENSEYKNGYISGSETIKWFWEVFHDLPLAEKKKFLLFLTGSDRIPIQGMQAIKIAIQPVSDDRCLPVAHTCFNLLDLPRYNTKERLKYKLLQAIQQTQGFNLV